MNTKKILATLALSTLLLTGCGFHGKDTIVIVNNDKITKADFDKALKTYSNNGAIVNLTEDKTSPVYLLIKDRVVNELVVRKLLEQEIQKRQITITPEEEQDAIKAIIDRYGSNEKFQAILKQNGVSNEQFKKDVQSELKMRKLINMLGSVSVSNSEVKDFYKKNPDRFKYPEKVRASHILISANPKEVEAYVKSNRSNQGLSQEEIAKKVEEEMNSQKAKAEKVLAEVKANPRNFAKIAKANSEDVASGQKGGDLGFFAYTDMVEPFSKVAFSLKPNKVSDLVQTDYGYHIIMTTDRAKAGTLTFDKAKDDIKQYLLIEKQVKLLENLIVQLKNNAKIEFTDEEYKPSKPKEDINKSEIKK